MKRLALVATLSWRAVAAPVSDQWFTAQNAHFEVYSQAGPESAQKALIWLEQLRFFFQQNGLLAEGVNGHGRAPLQAIGFRSEKEYAEYRSRPFADAYYVSDGARDYIVIGSLGPKAFRIAAHEYAHYALHANGLKLPVALNEGLAEFFSTLRLGEVGYELGGGLPARMQALQNNAWLPLAELFDSSNADPNSKGRRGLEIFYAESWALVDMLMTSPQYGARFSQLISEFNAGSDAQKAFQNAYGESLGDVEKNLVRWIGKTQRTHVELSRQAGSPVAQSSKLSAPQTSALLARLSLVSGHLEQARSRYEELSRQETGNPDFPAALGVIALRQGNRGKALQRWQQAIEGGVNDAELCYRFALLAEEAGWNTKSVKAALERAVTLSPALDDARYKLALIESQAGEYSSSVEQLRTMRVPAGARRYAYWTALASALTELDRRDEAKQAAQEALKAAQTSAERLQARQMEYIAGTDLTVQFASDSEGHSQMVTTRVPHGTTEWNPFIEASDQIQRASGKLSEVFCAAGRLAGFLVRTANGPLTVEVPDPSHVLMRNSPDEFLCGPISEKLVEADYAVVKAAGKTTNVLRGMTFQ